MEPWDDRAGSHRRCGSGRCGWCWRSTGRARAQRDATLREQIQQVWQANFRVYGVVKVWRALRRQGVAVARCTVARLMRGLGLRGAGRGRAFTITTRPDEAAARPADLVQRTFTATRPNQCRWTPRRAD